MTNTTSARRRGVVTAVAGAALLATSSAFTFSALPSSTVVSSSNRGSRRSRVCSAQQQPSMVASMPRVADSPATTGTGGASGKRLHVQVRVMTYRVMHKRGYGRSCLLWVGNGWPVMHRGYICGY